MDMSNDTSQERCWLGDTVVPLADINTEDPSVVSAFQDWITSLVREYGIDGLRIDGSFSHPSSSSLGLTPPFSCQVSPLASIYQLSFMGDRHVNIDFWPGFCAAAGVFCIGEVFSLDIECAFRHYIYSF